VISHPAIFYGHNQTNAEYLSDERTDLFNAHNANKMSQGNKEQTNPGDQNARFPKAEGRNGPPRSDQAKVKQ